jgi:hypothetical protein
MSHIDFSKSTGGNANSVHSTMESQSSAISALLHKIESSLQTSMAQITSRDNNCTEFGIQFGKEEMEYPAVLAFDKKLYTIIGMPRIDDTVVVIHNNHNNAHILFVANDRNLKDPPLHGSTTTYSKSISSSKCMG